MTRLSELPLDRPGATVLVALGAVVLSGLALARLDLRTDVSELLETPAVRTLARTTRVFGLNERSYLLVESEREDDEERLVRFARAFGERVVRDPAVARVRYDLPAPDDAALQRLIPYGLLYAEPDQVKRLLSRAGMREQLEVQIARLRQQGLGEAETWVERDPLDLHRPLLRRFAALRGTHRVAADSDRFLSEDRRALLLTVVSSQGPSDLGHAKRVVTAVEAATRELLQEPWTQGLSTHAAGGHFLAEESERIIREDVVRGFALCLALAFLLLAYGLRLNLLVVLALLLPTVWGIVVGLGLFALLQPSLAVLSLGCATALVGLGIDFTIHVAAAARAARAAGLAPREAVLEAVRRTRGALVLAALSSMAAFLAFQAAHQQFLAHMGLLIACGLLACLVGALTLLPLLLRWFLRAEETPPPRTMGAAWAAEQVLKRPGAVLGSASLLSLAAVILLVVRPPGIETDLRNLHASRSAPLAAQERIARTYGGSREPLVLLLEGADEAAVVADCHRLEPHLRALHGAPDGLTSHASITALLPSAADQGRVQEVLSARDGKTVRAELSAVLEEVGFEPAAFEASLAGLERAVGSRQPLEPGSLRELGLGDLVDAFVRPKTPDGPAHGLILLYPQETLLAGPRRAAFVANVRAALGAAGVEAGLSGLPVVAAESSALLTQDFRRIALLTVLAVVVVLLIRFRSPRLCALALTPAALGTLWTAALFAVLGIDLNLMTLAVLPMVLAIGVDDGIHVLHRHLDAGDDVIRTYHATAVGVVLTSLTTMVAFGSLAASRNLGLSSVGLLTLAGIGGCLVASVVVLPALLKLGERPREPTRDLPAPDGAADAPGGDGRA